MKERVKLKILASNLLTCVLSFVILLYLFNFKFYPYADDWIYVGALKPGIEFWDWVFSQHVDHFIPLQKAFQFILAKVFEYDFRFLVLANLVIAVLTVLALLGSARMYRGRPSWGDAIIPLAILNPAFGYSLWAFQFQFLSSIFFVAFFLYFSLLFHYRGKSIYFYAAYTSILLCALCGMNGFLFFGTIVAGLSLWYYTSRSGSIKFSLRNMLVLSVFLLVFALVALNWKPSSATVSEFNIFDSLTIFLFLQASCLSIYSFSSTALKALLFIGLFLFACMYAYRKHKTSGLNYSDIAIVLILIASQVVLFAIAVGRGGAQGGWSNALAGHYGFLAVLLPILAWVIVSSGQNVIWRNAIMLALLFVFSFSCYKGIHWCSGYMSNVIEHQLAVGFDLRSEPDIQRLVDKYVKDFTWKDTDEAKKPVMEGIEILRQRGFSKYTLLKFDQIKKQPPKIHSVTKIGNGHIDSVNGVPLVNRRITIGDVLSVRGWFAASVKQGILPKKVFITLSNKETVLFTQTHSYFRPDVAEAYNKVSLHNAGFKINLKIPEKVAGNYTIGLVYEKEGKYYKHSGFDVPITIKH